MKTVLQHSSLDIIHTASKDELVILFGLPISQRKTSGAIAWAMLRAKVPIRRKSKGNIQVKWIPYKQVVRGVDGKAIKDKSGQPIIETVQAPYLYVRYWQVQGDSDRKTSRVKSIYIGGDLDSMDRRKGGYLFRDLAHHFHDVLQEYGVARQRTIRKTGEIQTYKVRPKDDDNPIAELEDAIMACINMEFDPPEINHEGLLDLQFKITGFMSVQSEEINVQEADVKITHPTPMQKTQHDSQLKETLKSIRLFEKMFKFAGEEFERRHGRAWRWVKIYKARSGNRTLRSEAGETFAMGTSRWQIVSVLARFIETGKDHVEAFE